MGDSGRCAGNEGAEGQGKGEDKGPHKDTEGPRYSSTFQAFMAFMAFMEQ